MMSKMRKREKYQVTHVAMQVPLERPTNGSVITLATRVRNENLGGAVASRCYEQNDVVVTREQMDDTKYVKFIRQWPDGLQQMQQMST